MGAADSAAGLSGAEITAFIRVAAQIAERIQAGRRYKKLTIHRFHPHDDLGGPLGMLDFRREAVSRLIDRGFEDAVYHDCYQSHCIFPDAGTAQPGVHGQLLATDGAVSAEGGVWRGGDERHKQAMVLSGGGANGAYEVGVMRALFTGSARRPAYVPLEPHIFSGTSIGSFNASFLVSRWEAGGSAAIAELETFWLERLSRDGAAGENNGYRFLANPFELFDPRRFAADPFGAFGQFAQDRLRLVWDFFDRFMYVVNPDEDSPLTTRLLHTIAVDNFISREPFRRLIKDAIDFGAIRGSTKELKIATTNWETGQVREFGNYDFTDGLGPRIIMASSAIPGFFTPEEVGSQPYVDGSVLMNTPLKPMIVAGARVMHIIYLDPDVDSIPIHYLSNVLSTLYRTQIINWASVLNDDISDAENINEALVALGLAGREAEEVVDGDEVKVDEKRVMMALAKFGRHLENAARYKMLTIHRYHPRDELGGALSLLDLRRERIEYLVERGFRDAVNHDCKVSRCVIPAEPSAGPRASADPYRARPE